MKICLVCKQQDIVARMKAEVGTSLSVALNVVICKLNVIYFFLSKEEASSTGDGRFSQGDDIHTWHRQP